MLKRIRNVTANRKHKNPLNKISNLCKIVHLKYPFNSNNVYKVVIHFFSKPLLPCCTKLASNFSASLKNYCEPLRTGLIEFFPAMGGFSNYQGYLFSMQVLWSTHFLLPKSICSEIEKLAQEFYGPSTL